MSNNKASTIEFLGTTTFRMEIQGLVIFHDCWLDRPESLTNYLKPEHVDHADYILINHAHFDHLPGADVVAKRTGAKVIANGEAIRVLRELGVPEDQLIPVAGGEHIKLPNGVVVRPYPGLHCLMPYDHHALPEFITTDMTYKGEPGQSPMDITNLMTNGLGNLPTVPDDQLPSDQFRVFKKYIANHRSRFSLWDGGCLMFNINIPGEGTLFFNAHCGAYMGLLNDIHPRPDVAIIAPSGQPCVNGDGYTGTTNEYIAETLKRLGQPAKVAWCLHDQSPLPPHYVDTTSLEQHIQEQTPETKVFSMIPTKAVPIFD